LKPGDLIAVTSPSSGVPEAMRPRLELCLEHLRQRGYQGPCAAQLALVNGALATVGFDGTTGTLVQQLV
jgi:hypothetical protein